MTSPNDPDDVSTLDVSLPQLDPTDPLGSLEQLLELESHFLGRLDIDGIDRISEQKELLLGSLVALKPGPEDLPRLARIRENALRNQLLTVHARDTVGAIVDAFCAPRLGSAHPPAAPRERVGVRLDMRG